MMQAFMLFYNWKKTWTTYSYTKGLISDLHFYIKIILEQPNGKLRTV